MLLAGEQTLDVRERDLPLAAEPRPHRLLAARHAQELAAKARGQAANRVLGKRAHRDQAEVLGVELIIELGSVDGRTCEQPLYALVAAQLGRVGHALGLLLVLVG